MVTPPPVSAWLDLVERALREDLGAGDVTSTCVFTADQLGAARIEARQELIVCGLPVAEQVFASVDPSLAFRPLCAEGVSISAGIPLAEIRGPLLGIAGEEVSPHGEMGYCCETS